MSSQPSVAVVILNWNGRKFLEQFLPSLTQSTYCNLRFIVADNGSTDDSLDFLRKHYPTILILENKINQGFAMGYNTALRQVESEYYILLNSDVEVTQSWIEPMVELLENDRSIAACQPKMLEYANKHLFEYSGASGGWMDSYGYPFCRGRIFDSCEADNGQYNTQEAIFWASGAAMFVRAQIFHEMGGFDDYFFAHQEEIDLCWRMQLAGYKIFACPSSVIYHVGGGTLPKTNSQKTFLNFRNNLVMLSKNYSWWERLLKIPFRIGLDLVSASKSLLSGNSQFFTAIIRAHFAYLGWLFSSKKQSRFPIKRTGHPSGIYRGNVVWDYFVRKKKTFSEITRPKK